MIEELIRLKIEYARELRLALESEAINVAGKERIWTRAKKVYDSIESDLGINQPESEGKE